MRDKQSPAGRHRAPPAAELRRAESKQLLGVSSPTAVPGPPPPAAAVTEAWVEVGGVRGGEHTMKMESQEGTAAGAVAEVGTTLHGTAG